MNEFEFAEAFSALMNAGLSATGLYFTAVTGYLITAYLVGSSLTRSQLLIISVLFVVFAFIVHLSAFLMIERAIVLEVKLEGKRDAMDYSTYVLLIAGILGILASLKFMADVRKPEKGNGEDV